MLQTSGALIKVIGVGGGGGNAVNRMIDLGLDCVEFWTLNTDQQHLNMSKTPNRIQLGSKLTKGLGAGGDPAVGTKSAEESTEDIKACLTGADLVFITTGMGGGTGTGATPIVARIARELGILSVGIVTTPFKVEGKLRQDRANDGVNQLREYVDSLIVIPNDRVYELMKAEGIKLNMNQAFLKIDEILANGVLGISEIINKPGFVNVDFSDISKAMRNAGNAMMGIGSATGENRAIEACKRAIENKLLDVSINGATNVIAAIMGDDDLGIDEWQLGMEYLNNTLGTSNIEIKMGIINDNSMPKGEIKAIVIATGFKDGSSEHKTPKFSLPPTNPPSGGAPSSQPTGNKSIDFPQLPKFKKL